MRHRPLVPLVAAVLVAALAGATPASAAPPKRIAALTPFTANTLVALGVKPVAVGETVGGNERFSKRLQRVKRIPLTHPNGPNLEQLAVLDPQLVLSAPTWRKGAQTMRRLQMKVVESEPANVAAVAVETRRIGALVGRKAQAERIARQQAQAIAAAKRRVKRHPKVLVLLGVGRTPYAFLRSSWGGDLVTQAGGRLITAGLGGSGGFARISNEYVVQQDPDIIIAVPHGNARDLGDTGEYLKTNPAWRDTKAVRNGRLYLSTDNTLLQPWTTAATSIHIVQKLLKNT